jgi:hypothetical protein
VALPIISTNAGDQTDNANAQLILSKLQRDSQSYGALVGAVFIKQESKK